MSDQQLAIVTALAMLSGSSVAALLGKDPLSAATAAQNEALNNWARHIKWLPGQKSEAEQLAQAKQDCSPANSAACSDAQALTLKSSQRDEALAKACIAPSSASCAFQKLLATFGGNDVRYVNGVAIAEPAPQPTQAAPNLAAATLDNMLGNPFAGIFGGAAYYWGSAQDAYYASQLGNSVEGLLAGGVGASWLRSFRNVATETTAATGGGASTVKSPNPAMRELANSTGGMYINPETGLVEISAERLAADHFYPQELIKKMDGFDKLTPKQQSSILNDPLNTEGLPKTYNSSKGAKIPGEWTVYKGTPLNAEYVNDAAQRGAAMQQYLQNRINSYLNGGN